MEWMNQNSLSFLLTLCIILVSGRSVHNHDTKNINHIRKTLLVKKFLILYILNILHNPKACLSQIQIKL